jgi:hypothetical protein
MLIPLILNNHGSDNESAHMKKKQKDSQKDDNFDTIKKESSSLNALKASAISTKFFVQREYSHLGNNIIK